MIALAVGLLIAVSMCLTAVPANAQAAPASVDVPQLKKLVQLGRFGEVLEVLDEMPVENDPQVKRYADAVQRYVEHRRSQDESRQEAYHASLAEVRDLLKQEKYPDAVNEAILAQSLSDRPQELLDTSLFKDLVLKTETAAHKAAEQHRWLTMLNLYRGLNLLFEQSGRFDRPLRQVRRRVRLIRMYAPEAYRDMLVARAKQQGREDTDEIKVSDEGWEKALRKIRSQMLEDAVLQAALRHVSNPGYTDMLVGAIQAVQIMLDTPQLQQTFRALGDAEQAELFREALERTREAVQQRVALNTQDARKYLREIIEVNEQTVQLPEPVIVHELTNGAMSTLDEFSNVIWPSEMDLFSRSVAGNFTGVGIQISLSPGDGRLKVVSPLPDTPAHQAHIKPGDIIVSVDGEDTSGWSLNKAVSEITGEEGTDVVLGIERLGVNEPLEVRLTRAKITIESVRGWSRNHDNGDWNYFIDPDRRIGYVRVSQFIPATVDDLDAAINRMLQSGPLNGLILDLRFNPGGLLQSSVEMVDRFIERGAIVSTVDGAGRETTDPLKARVHRTHPGFPMVVLINQGSASASEIVSGALQAHDRALVIGNRTFGKGSVQDLYRIDGARALLKLTTQYYKLPNGRIIHRKPQAKTWGIQPDLAVDVTGEQIEALSKVRREADVLFEPEDLEKDPDKQPVEAEQILVEGLDPQLQSALLVLRTNVVADRIARLAAAHARQADAAAN